LPGHDAAAAARTRRRSSISWATGGSWSRRPALLSRSRPAQESTHEHRPVRGRPRQASAVRQVDQGRSRSRRARDADGVHALFEVGAVVGVTADGRNPWKSQDRSGPAAVGHAARQQRSAEVSRFHVPMTTLMAAPVVVDQVADQCFGRTQTSLGRAATRLKGSPTRVGSGSNRADESQTPPTGGADSASTDDVDGEVGLCLGDLVDVDQAAGSAEGSRAASDRAVEVAPAAAQSVVDAARHPRPTARAGSTEATRGTDRTGPGRSRRPGAAGRPVCTSRLPRRAPRPPGPTEATPGKAGSLTRWWTTPRRAMRRRRGGGPRSLDRPQAVAAPPTELPRRRRHAQNTTRQISPGSTSGAYRGDPCVCPGCPGGSIHRPESQRTAARRRVPSRRPCVPARLSTIALQACDVGEGSATATATFPSPWTRLQRVPRPPDMDADGSR